VSPSDYRAALYHAYWDAAAKTLAIAWRIHRHRRETKKASIALALSFDTHRTLTHEQQLSSEQAIALMTKLVENA
jgi:hypothetical protein